MSRHYGTGYKFVLGKIRRTDKMFYDTNFITRRRIFTAHTLNSPCTQLTRNLKYPPGVMFQVLRSLNINYIEVYQLLFRSSRHVFLNNMLAQLY